MTKQQYIQYLIATNSNYTRTNLADHSEADSGVSHDVISDYLRREKLTPRALWELVGPLIENDPSGYLIVDDSVQDKRYSTAIEMVKLQYSGAVHGLVRGIGVVNLMRRSKSERRTLADRADASRTQATGRYRTVPMPQGSLSEKSYSLLLSCLALTKSCG